MPCIYTISEGVYRCLHLNALLKFPRFQLIRRKRRANVFLVKIGQALDSRQRLIANNPQNDKCKSNEKNWDKQTFYQYFRKYWLARKQTHRTTTERRSHNSWFPTAQQLLCKRTSAVGRPTKLHLRKTYSIFSEDFYYILRRLIEHRLAFSTYQSIVHQ